MAALIAGGWIDDARNMTTRGPRHDLPVVLRPSVVDHSPETQRSYRLGDLGRIFLVSIPEAPYARDARRARSC